MAEGKITARHPVWSALFLSQNPYTVLGVSRQATADDIRSAYRRLAKQFHPDKNQGNAAAEDRFKAVNAAFDILGDTEKRRRFDRGEIDADGNERVRVNPGAAYGARPRGQSGPFRGSGPSTRQPPPGGFDDISDIFSDIFGRSAQGRARQGSPSRGADIRYRLTVDFLEAARGTTKRVVLQGGQSLDVGIPEGLRDGQTLRLRGKGKPGANGGPAGDVLVEVSVRPHPVYSLKGDDVTMELPITLKEAVMGGKIELPTLRGTVMIRLPANTSSGVSFRLREKGMKNPKTGTIGDLYAKTSIVLPEEPNEALKSFVEAWKEGDDQPREDLFGAAD